MVEASMTRKAIARHLIKSVAAAIEALLHEVRYNRSSIGCRLFAREQRTKVERWERAGRPDPPPDHIKHAIIRSYARRFGVNTLVETGTFVGDTPAALQADFERIYTIELDPRLCAAACRRFRHQSNITVIQGESGVVLGELAYSLPQPVLFWLDGHWSGGVTARGPEDSPILREAATILGRSNPSDVLLIDDARLFGIKSYPSVAQVRRLILDGREDWEVYVEHDIIRAHARRTDRPTQP
jgi:hypothetical protein